MYTVIGLGNVGCDLAELFESNPEYKVKLIDVDIEGENCFSLPQQKTSEAYERNIPDLSIFFSDVTEKILLILDGSATISGCALQVLKQINNKELNVLYIRSDTEMLGSIAKLQDRVVFNVLQEYARSGVFKNIFLVSVPSIENILGDMPIVEYSKNVNKIIYNTFATIIKFQNEEAIVDNFSQPKEVSRIVTFGAYDIENNAEKMFYPLNFIDDKCYYFGINENELKTNNKLFRLIKDRMREKNLDNTKISYKIHSTSYEQNFCYVVSFSRKIQE